MAEVEQPDLTTLTVQLLSAYVANNSVANEDLAGLIQATRKALAGEQAPVEPEAPEFLPAVSVRKSLASRDSIISLIDGKAYKTLKRHLATHGLTPEQYRERYKLPRDYPMVAPAFAEQRRKIAERIGLGRKPGTQAEAGPIAAGATPSNSPADAPAKAVSAKGKRTRRAKVAEPAALEAAAEQVAATIDAVKRRDTKSTQATALETGSSKSSAARGRKRATTAAADKTQPSAGEVASAEVKSAPTANARPGRRAKLKIAVGASDEPAKQKKAGRPRKTTDSVQN